MHDLPIIARFLDHLEGERNFSAHTVRSYCADLTQFCRFLAAHNGRGDGSGKPPTVAA